MTDKIRTRKNIQEITDYINNITGVSNFSLQLNKDCDVMNITLNVSNNLALIYMFQQCSDSNIHMTFHIEGVIKTLTGIHQAGHMGKRLQLLAEYLFANDQVEIKEIERLLPNFKTLSPES